MSADLEAHSQLFVVALETPPDKTVQVGPSKLHDRW